MTQREIKTPRDSEVIMSQTLMPQDTNPAGNVHGGVILKLIDEAAGIVAARHFRGNVVTASIDRMSFRAPVYVGELVTLKARLNAVGRTSMEIGVRVEAENLITGDIRWTNTAYLTYVGLDENGRPAEVPGLKLETPEDERRNREATERRKGRLEEAERERKSAIEVNR